MGRRLARISEIADINPGVDLRGLSPTSPVSFIPMADVSEEGIWWHRQERMLKDVRVGFTPFSDNDVLFAKITPCMENGKGAHVSNLKNGVGFGSTEFHVLRATGDNSPRFLFHWLQAQPTRTRALAFMGGSAGQQRVQAEFFRHYEVPYFEPPNQSRIAYVLDTIDEAIQKTEAVIAKLKQIRAGMLHDLLTYGLDKDGKLRDPVAHPEQFKDSELGRIPKEWEVAEIVQLFDLGRGRVISQHDLRACPGDYPVYSSQSANDGIFGYLGTFDFEGDYITWTTDGANAGTVFFRSGRFNCTNVCGTLKSKGRITEAFGALALGTVAKKHVSYVGNPKLMNNIVARIKIKYPKSTDEQQAAVKALDETDQKVAAEARELQKLVMAKAGLMDDLLSGDVPVPKGARS